MVHAASTLALAALEYLVHVDPEDVPFDLVAMELAVPLAATVTIESLARASSQRIGEQRSRPICAVR